MSINTTNIDDVIYEGGESKQSEFENLIHDKNDPDWNSKVSNIILDFSVDVNDRLHALEMYYNENKDDSIELVSRIGSMYSFSGTKSLEIFLYMIATKSKLSSFLKLEAVKSLLSFFEESESIDKADNIKLKESKIDSNEKIKKRNTSRKELAYEALNITCSDLCDIATPCKIEAVSMLMECEKYKTNSFNYFTSIINDHTIDTDYRYKAILSLESRKENDKLYEKWNIPDREFFLRECFLKFLYNSNNRTMYRILSGQYLLQRITIDAITNRKIQLTLLGFAQDETLDFNLRADSADTLLNLGDEHIKMQARSIIMILGREFGSRTIFDNSQNVHVKEVEDSVSEALHFLTSLPLLTINNIQIDFEYVNSQIVQYITDEKKPFIKEPCSKYPLCKELPNEEDLKDAKQLPQELSEIIKLHYTCYYCNSCTERDNNIDDKYFCSDACFALYDNEDKIMISLNRINVDRILYSKYNQTLANILMKVWTYIVGHEYKDEIIHRLLEELIDMSGTCSSGFASRLVNVISAYSDFNIKISWEDQITSNFAGRLNALIRKITDPSWIYYNQKMYDVVELYMRGQKLIKTKKDANELDSTTSLKTVIDSYLSTDRYEKIRLAVEEFADNVLCELTINSSRYHEKPNFIYFFKNHMLAIREELYEEFKDYITDSEFDLASRRAISVYEGATDFI